MCFVGNVCHSLRVKAAPQPVEALELLKRPHRRKWLAFFGFGKSPVISGNLGEGEILFNLARVLIVSLKLTANFTPGKLRGLEDDSFPFGAKRPISRGQLVFLGRVPKLKKQCWPILWRIWG